MYLIFSVKHLYVQIKVYFQQAQFLGEDEEKYFHLIVIQIFINIIRNFLMFTVHHCTKIAHP